MRAATRALAIVVCVVSNLAAAQTIPSDAANCRLRFPPSGAGEDVSWNKTPMKFFPRAKDIPTNYTGCQKVWSVFRDNWIPFSTRYFEKGEIKVFLGPLVEGQNQAHCLFTNGRRSPSSTKGCPSFEEAKTPSPSLPAGCIAELQAGSPTNRCKRYE